MKRLLAYYSITHFPTLFLLLLITVTAALITGNYLFMAIVPALLIFSIAIEYPSVIFLVLLATIPLSVELKITDTLGTDFPDEMLMWLLTAIILIHLVLHSANASLLVRHPLIILLMAGLCWTMITICYSTHPLLSVKYFLAKIWYIVPFCIGTVIFLERPQMVLIAARCMLIAMTIATTIILIRHAIAGLGFDQVNEVARPIFRNHVNYAALLVCMIPVSYAVYKNAVRYKFLWLFILLLFLFALFLTYSRGAWLALATAMITVLFVRKKMISVLIVSVTTLVITSIIWFSAGNRYLNYRPVYEQTIYHSNFDEHLAATYSLRDLSTAERFYRWIAAFRMSNERLVTGYGPNSFYYEYQPFAVNSFSTYVSNNQEHSTVHNYFLLLLTEQGVPGMILFVVLFFSMMIYAQKIYHQNRDHFQRGLILVILSLLSMIGVLIFLSDLMETDKIGSIFYICLGLLVSRKAPASSI